jgi:Mannosyl-glycoprotein endo-beta-N-acetylglucosaminidase
MQNGRLGLLALSGAGLIFSFAGDVRPAIAQQSAGPASIEIRSSASNRVPTCVTPDRLMRHLKVRNAKLSPRFDEIAALYKKHGDANQIRWDYAFYQMILETNYLAYGGDVKAHQNNFAGVGATGGGVRGDGFPDVSTGVLAQIQHLVAYSGERVENPVAKRTQEVQGDVIAKSKKLGRAVRYSDLTNRWAADRKYARSIELIADRFRADICSGKDEIAAEPAAPEKKTAAATAAANDTGAKLARQAADSRKPAQRSNLGAAAVANTKPVGCSVMTASYGDAASVLIRAVADDAVTFTALGVERGQEAVMAENFIKAHTQGGSIAGRFKTRDEAIAKAWSLCDSGKP